MKKVTKLIKMPLERPLTDSPLSTNHKIIAAAAQITFAELQRQVVFNSVGGPLAGVSLRRNKAV